MHKLLHAANPNPTFQTVFKIAEAFTVSIDRVLDRSLKNDINIIQPISVENSSKNLQNYLTNYLANNNLHPVKLAYNLGLGTDTIRDFINLNSAKKTLSIPTIIKIADHLDISIDEMIGRTTPTQEKLVTKNQPSSIVGITNADDIANLESIKLSVAKNVQSLKKDSKLSVKKNNSSKKSSSHVERLMQKRSKQSNNNER